MIVTSTFLWLLQVARKTDVCTNQSLHVDLIFGKLILNLCFQYRMIGCLVYSNQSDMYLSFEIITLNFKCISTNL